MSELELERNHKRRLNDEMKRMQKETMLLEKEITHKNNKIYELEMSNLKQNRTSKTNLTTLKSYEERTLKYSRPSRSELNNKSDRSQSSLKTLNLM
jgi:phage terminase large subunit-like protein